jgi:sugar lactone lactonase YvrE
MTAARAHVVRAQARPFAQVLWLVLVMHVGCARERDAADGGMSEPDARMSADARPHVWDPAPPVFEPTPISLENEQDGVDVLALAGVSGAAQLAAYASATSVAAGESVDVFAHVVGAQEVGWELFRIGYYQGRGARQIASGARAQVNPQPACPTDPDTGLVECQWQSAFSITTDAAWPSGYYAFKLTAADGSSTLVPLILREREPRAPVVVQASVNTWQAYNTWGGTSLYKNTRKDSSFRGARAQRVSFDRPYDRVLSAFMKEVQFVRFAEQRGYDMAYVTNLDVDGDPTLLKDRKLFVSVWHDEYWSVAERDALDSARDAGTSLAFLSANTGYWRVRLTPASDGTLRRVITCYKAADRDPSSNAIDTTVQFRQQPHARPENALLGIMYGDWSDFTGFPFLVRNHAHWLYRGTGVVERETLSPIIGTEWDAVADNTYTPEELEIVGDSPVVSQVGVPFPHAQASVYYPTDHSFVFASGSIAWATGLYGSRSDPRVQRMTENVFARAGFAAQMQTEAPPRPSTTEAAGYAGRVLAGGEEGFRDGPAERARFSSPSGLAQGPDGQLYVADTGNHVIRKIDARGNVTTFAGCAPDGSVSAELCFDNPIGLAVDEAGFVYVSDSGHSRIRRVDQAGQVSEYAGSGTAGAKDADDLRSAQFSNPRGLSLDRDGTLYVADFNNSAIRAVRPDGVTTVARDIPEIVGVAADSGKLYATSYEVNRLVQIEAGVAKPWIGRELAPLEGLAVDPDQSALIVADAGNYRVVRIALGSTNIQNILGDGQYGDAPNHVSLPRGVARFGAGWAVSDSGHHRILLITDTQPAPSE